MMVHVLKRAIHEVHFSVVGIKQPDFHSSLPVGDAMLHTRDTTGENSDARRLRMVVVARWSDSRMDACIISPVVRTDLYLSTATIFALVELIRTCLFEVVGQERRAFQKDVLSPCNIYVLR